MQEGFADNDDLRRRFLVEAELTGRLEHPGVVPVYGLGVDEQGRPFYAMRLIRGVSLKDAIVGDTEQADPAARIFRRRSLLTGFVEVCRTVAYAHWRGVIHRDLKPANVMIGSFGETFVVDWGLARPIENAEEPLPVLPDGRPDVTRGAIGTPAYMSPEQAEGPPAVVGVTSDIYSLGATLYTVLTGRPPFEAGTLDLTLAAVRRGDFPPPRQRDGSVPLDIQAVCLKAMALRPEDRYASAGELAQDVERFLADEPVTARREPKSERLRRFLKRHRTLALSLGILLLGSTLSLAIALARVSDANRAEREARAEAEESAARAGRQRDEADAQRRQADEARRRADEARTRAEQSERKERRERYATNVSLAHQAWQSGRVVQARQLLRDLLPRPGQEDLRGFEWRYLWRLVHETVPSTFRPHLGPVASAAFAPDGKHVVTGGGDGCVLLWEAETGRPVRSFVPDPDDRDGSLGLDWDVRGGRVVVSSVHPLGPAALDGRLRPGDELVSLAGRPRVSSPEQARQYEAGPAGGAVAVEARRGGRAFRVTLIRRHVLRDALQALPAARAALGPDGRTLVTAARRAVCLWDAQTGAPRQTFRLPGGTVLALTLSPDGRLAATGDDAGVIRLWDVERRHPAGTITYNPTAPGEPSHGAQVRALAFSADGKTLLAGVGTALLFCDPQRRKVLDVAFQPDGGVSAVAGHPEGKQWLVGGTPAGDNLELWDPLRRQLASRLYGLAGPVRAVAFTPDGAGVLGGGTDGLPRLWDRETGRTRRLFPGHGRTVTALACSPDGKTLVSGDAEGVVVLHDLHHEADTLLGRSSDPVHDLAFTPDGKAVMTGGYGDKAVCFWDATTGHLMRRLDNVINTEDSLALSPDGKALACIDHLDTPPMVRNGERALLTVSLRSAADGKVLRRLTAQATPGQRRGTEGLRCLAYSPDGKSLAAGGAWVNVHVWDTATGAERCRVGVGIYEVALGFAPDGRTLAVADSRNRIQLYDPATGKELPRPRGLLGGPYGMALTPDGRALVTPGGDASLVLWDPSTGQERRRLRGPEQSGVAGLLLSADGTTIVSEGRDRKVRVWDVASGGVLRELAGDYLSHPSRLLAVSADGKSFALIDEKPGVKVVDAVTGKLSGEFTAGPAGVRGAAFLAGRPSLVVWSGDRKAREWDLVTGKELRHVQYTDSPARRPGPPFRMRVGGDGPSHYVGAVSQDGRLVAFGSENGLIAVHDLATGRELRRVEGLPDSVGVLSFSPDGRTLAWAGGDDPKVRLVEVSTGKERQALTGHTGRIVALAFSADGSTLASGSADTTALVWDLAGKRAPKPEGLDGPWEALRGADAALAYRAVRQLAASPKVEGFLTKEVRPIPAEDAARVARLIAGLDSDRFETRAESTKGLEALGDRAAQALREVLAAGPSPESRRRIESLLKRLASDEASPSAERVRLGRALEALELAGARKLLEVLAAGAPGAWLTEEAKASLARLKSRGPLE
ncbi:MAG: protein kinase [Gemmataceae bacterium]